MSGKDFLRLLLIEYGFTKSINIKVYHGDGINIGYEIEATDNKGNEYFEDNCEGLMFNIYLIIKYMKEHNIKIICGGVYSNVNYSTKDLLSDDILIEYNKYHE